MMLPDFVAQVNQLLVDNGISNADGVEVLVHDYMSDDCIMVQNLTMSTNGEGQLLVHIDYSD